MEAEMDLSVLAAGLSAPDLNVVDISRWQFGITTVYHFIFVPLTIGLAPLVALMQTFWAVTKKPHWYRATRFFGTVLLVNFAMGVATGIVQEFQFGMNWSEYARMVGDVFGGPLAFEGLIAFFMESVFLGMWIFGWGKLPVWLHTLSIWLVALAVNLSAYFIIVANSFMQHPVGAEYNPDTGRAELVDIVALLTNPTALAAFPHAVAGSFLTAGTFVLGVSGWWLIRAHRKGLLSETGDAGDAGDAGSTGAATTTAAAATKTVADNKHSMYRPAMRVGWWTVVLSSIALFITGDVQGKLMFKQQPIKMASAESLCHTETNPMFSILTLGTHNNCESVIHLIKAPWVLPFLAEGKFSGVTLQGVVDLQAKAEALYGPGNYAPNLFVTYWSFRAMIGLMLGSLALAFFVWLFTRNGRLPQGRWKNIFAAGCVASLPFPFLANSAGWIFTEMGRQPWIVHPNPDSIGDPRTEMMRMTVDMGVTDHSAWNVVITLVGFTLLYGALFVVWFWLIRRTVLQGPPDAAKPAIPTDPSPAGSGGNAGSHEDSADGTDAAGADARGRADDGSTIRFAHSGGAGHRDATDEEGK
ncbi:cytochrome ubiquinol oxidase subunit I [Corynebacterium falsenii]|uniref:cytochrome ubiquinol oxidase subunit I n=1 Tax=Corynebacterium falsenii TaxID=108486 RepID=UPI003FD44E34